MSFAPQRRAIFRHPKFKKRSAPEVFCTFWLENAHRATMACNFSTSKLQKVVRSWCVLCILTWKCASRYSGVQFFISPLNSYLRTRRFTEPTFRPSRPTNHWKNAAFRDFPNISRLLIFFLLTFAQLYLLSSDSTSLLCFFSFWLCYSALLLQLSILSEVRLLNFLRLTIHTRNGLRSPSNRTARSRFFVQFPFAFVLDVVCKAQWTASVHTLHTSKPVITFVLKVLRNALLWYILYTCPNLWKRLCSKCYAMHCFGTYFTHVETCDNVRVQSATQWTASVILYTCRNLWERSFAKCYAMDCFGTYFTHV